MPPRQDDGLDVFRRLLTGEDEEPQEDDFIPRLRRLFEMPDEPEPEPEPEDLTKPPKGLKFSTKVAPEESLSALSGSSLEPTASGMPGTRPARSDVTAEPGLALKALSFLERTALQPVTRLAGGTLAGIIGLGKKGMAALPFDAETKQAYDQAAEELRRVARRHFEQAAAIPISVFTDPTSETFQLPPAEVSATGGDILESIGVGEMGHLPWVGSTRSVLGFGLDILTPAPGVTAAIRGAGVAGKLTGKAVNEALEKVVAKQIPVASASAQAALEGIGLAKEVGGEALTQFGRLFSRRLAIRKFEGAAERLELAERKERLYTILGTAEARAIKKQLDAVAVERAEARGVALEDARAQVIAEVNKTLETQGVRESVAAKAGVTIPPGVADLIEEAAEIGAGKAGKIAGQAETMLAKRLRRIEKIEEAVFGPEASTAAKTFIESRRLAGLADGLKSAKTEAAARAVRLQKASERAGRHAEEQLKLAAKILTGAQAEGYSHLGDYTRRFHDGLIANEYAGTYGRLAEKLLRKSEGERRAAEILGIPVERLERRIGELEEKAAAIPFTTNIVAKQQMLAELAEQAEKQKGISLANRLRQQATIEDPLKIHRSAAIVLENLSPGVRELARRVILGSRDVFERLAPEGFGKIRRQEILEAQGIVTRDRMVGFYEAHPELAHLRHDFKSPQALAIKLMRDVQEAMPELADELAQRIKGLESGGPVRGAAMDFLTRAKSSRIEKIRKIPGQIAEIEKDFPGSLENDLVKIILGEGRQVATSVPAAEFVRHAVKTWAKPPLPAEAGIHGKIFYAEPGYTVVSGAELAKTPPWLQAEFVMAVGKEKVPITLPNEIWEAMSPAVKKLGRDPQMHSVKRFWNWWQRFFPAITVSAYPDTLLANVFGGGIQNFLSLPLEKLLPAYREAQRILRGPRVISHIQVEGGKRLKYSEFANELILDGGRGSGFVATAFGEDLAADFMGTELKGLRKFFSPSASPVVRIGYALNVLGDDLNRIAHYLVQRRLHGRDFARESMRKWLYDPATLDTRFQKIVARGAMPFYAWHRWNIPASIRTFINSPRRAMAVHMRVNEDGEVDVPDDLLPEWIQQQAHIPTGRSGSKVAVWIASRWIPIEVIQQVDSLPKLASFILGNAEPVVRTLVENTIGKDIFFKREIQGLYPDEETILGMRVTKPYARLLRVLRPITAIDKLFRAPETSEINDAVLDDMTAWNRAKLIGKRLFGFDERVYDLGRAKPFVLREYRDNIRSLGRHAAMLRQRREPGDLENAGLNDAKRREIEVKLRWLAGWDIERDLKVQDLRSAAQRFEADARR